MRAALIAVDKITDRSMQNLMTFCGWPWYQRNSPPAFSGNATVELTVRDAPDSTYTVAAYVAHINDAQVDARERMRFGHYIAYVCCEGIWFEINDQQVHAHPCSGQAD